MRGGSRGFADASVTVPREVAPHRADVRLEAVLVDLVLAVVADRDRQEVVLQVGMLDAGAAPDEAAGFEMVGRAESLAQQQPFEADGAHGDEILRRVQRDRLRARVLHVGLEVILQVRADARHVRHDVDVELARAPWHRRCPTACRICGELIAPPDTITSRRARIVTSCPLCRYSTPTARVPSNSTRVTRHRGSIRRLGRVIAGRRYAIAALQRRPRYVVRSIGPRPSCR